jgi:hypothetical protein
MASALGLFLVLTCLVAFGVGVWEILDPAGFDRLVRLLLSVVPTDMPHH